MLGSDNEGQNLDISLDFPENAHNTRFFSTENVESNRITNSQLDKEGMYNNCIETGVIPQMKSEMKEAEQSGLMPGSPGLPLISDTLTVSAEQS